MSRAREASKTLTQMAAVLVFAGILAMVAHKAHADISVIAAKHSGAEFWRALAVYLIGNLAGGRGPGGVPPAANRPG